MTVTPVMSGECHYSSTATRKVGKPVQSLAGMLLGEIRYLSSMKEVSSKNFGLLIAYLLPGFTALWGLSYVSETVRSWLGSPPINAPTIGGFLYVTLASVAAGLTVSTIRWAVIDTIHHWTGIPRPEWDFSRLQQNVTAFEVTVEHKYRYAQFYGNTLISLVLVYLTRRFSLGFWSTSIGWTDLAFFLLGVILFAGSRDTYRKYVLRGDMLLGEHTQAQAPAHRKPSQEHPPSCNAKQADAA